MKKIILLLMLSLRLSIAHPTAQTATHEPEIDSEKSRKIIGQRYKNNLAFENGFFFLFYDVIN